MYFLGNFLSLCIVGNIFFFPIVVLLYHLCQIIIKKRSILISYFVNWLLCLHFYAISCVFLILFKSENEPNVRSRRLVAVAWCLSLSPVRPLVPILPLPRIPQYMPTALLPRPLQGPAALACRACPWARMCMLCLRDRDRCCRRSYQFSTHVRPTELKITGTFPYIVVFF